MDYVGSVLNNCHMFSSDQFLTCHVKYMLNPLSFKLTVVYASNVCNESRRLWYDLVSQNDDTPWIIMGDFNATINLNERLACRGIEDGGCTDMRTLFQGVGLEDIPFFWKFLYLV